MIVNVGLVVYLSCWHVKWREESGPRNQRSAWSREAELPRFLSLPSLWSTIQGSFLLALLTVSVGAGLREEGVQMPLLI